MAKGDDTVRKKKNKVLRKKLNRKNDSSTVSARIASVIASKKRRKSGVRRMCQGMCFSLPTLDDPFLENKDYSRKERNKIVPSKPDRIVSAKRKNNVPTKGSVPDHSVKVDTLGKVNEKVGALSKYLVLCLKEIEDALYPDGTYCGDEGKRLFVNPWGMEFWKCYSAGKDILESSGSSADFEQIAWIASTAADAITRTEKEGQSFTGPFLLFIVPSKEKALKVRSICKPLKAQGIHTVSLHSGASVDHQISGLQSCEPEFLVSTPERLLELVSLKAIDISGVSMLVIDGMESTSGDFYLETVKSIKQAILEKPHTTVFSNFFSNASVPAVQNLLNGLVNRLSLSDSVASQSACITQSIHVCSSKEEKIMKGNHVLDNVYCNQIIPQPLKVLFIVGKDKNVKKIVSAVKFKGYSISTGSNLNITDSENGQMRPAVSIIDTEHISSTDLGEYGVVIIPDFVLSIDDYVQILTRMARNTVNGVMHSFLTKDDAQHAGPLIEILEQCGHAVPVELRNL